jgi:hypothetical protein
MKVKYIARDGKMFDSEKECLEHENQFYELTVYSTSGSGIPVSEWLTENKDKVLTFLGADKTRYVKRTSNPNMWVSIGDVFELFKDGRDRQYYKCNSEEPVLLNPQYWTECDKDGNEL